jgi:hypothetical protein
LKIMVRMVNKQLATSASAIVKRLTKGRGKHEWISFAQGFSQVAVGLGLSHEVAEMVLYGLVATGLVAADIDIDEATIADLGHKPVRVSADDVRDWLRQHSNVPTGKLNTVITRLLSEGISPPLNIEWKPYCDLVRNTLGGKRIGKAGRPTISDRTITRHTKALQDR